MRRPFDASQVGPSLDRTGKPALSHCSLPEGSARIRMRRSRFTEDRLLAQAGLQCLFSFRMEQAPPGSRPAHFQGTFQSEVGIRFAFAILVSGIRLTAGASSFGADGVGCPTLRGGPWLSPQCRRRQNNCGTFFWNRKGLGEQLVHNENTDVFNNCG